MNVTHVLASPVSQTMDLLQDMFKGCPFDLDWDHMFIELGSREGKIAKIKPDEVYLAVPGSMNVWYDTVAGRSNLLLPLFPSRKMAARHRDIGDAWGRDLFRPVMFMGIAPNLRRNHRAFLNSIATGLVDRSPILGFSGETFEESSHGTPLFADFHRDYVERGVVSNQALLEMDEGID